MLYIAQTVFLFDYFNLLKYYSSLMKVRLFYKENYMKKIVMATLLAMVGFAASAQVAVTGKASVWMDNTKVGSASATSQVVEPTSNIAFSVKEDLGNGVVARGVIETSLVGNTINGVGTELGDRQSTVGLASKFGSIDFGRNVHSQFLAVTKNDAFGTLYGSVAGDVHNLRGLRLSQGTFVTLTPIQNVSFSYDRTQTGVGSEAQSYAVATSIAGVSMTVAEFKQGAEKSTVLGLGAKLGAANLFYTHSDDEGLQNSRGDLVGVRYTLANNLVGKASYGKTNTDVKASSVGLDYLLSKRTEVGVAYRNVDRAGTAYDVKQVGVGLTHRF